MKGNSVAAAVLGPYAQALLSLGQSSNLVDRFGEDAAYILEVLASSAELNQFLANPFTDDSTKQTVIRQVFGGQVHATMQNFLLLLVDKRRVNCLAGICEQYQVLMRKLNQTVLAEVTSAVELTEAQKQSIREKVTAMTAAHQVDVVTAIDPDLIGGVIIKVGSQVIDASLRGQLRRITLKLAGN
jgi:F-type H+-transporting ATPase subunit delta